MAYTTTHTNLSVTALTPEQHERTCGYWYTVTSGAMAHTAFATREGLDRWLAERNLTLDAELPAERGAWGTSRIDGTYRTETHIFERDFEAVKPVVITTTLSNGDYTLALVSEADDGIRTVHTLNPNVKTRHVFDHAHMRAVMS